MSELEQPPTQPTQPGWYPVDGGVQRYWDGQQWTYGGTVAIAWVVTVLTLGYMLPWAIAATHGKSNAGAIAVLNLLTGWTGIGWIIALVMACGANQTVAIRR